MQTLLSYLAANHAAGIVEHSIKADFDEYGFGTFSIHPVGAEHEKEEFRISQAAIGEADIIAPIDPVIAPNVQENLARMQAEGQCIDGFMEDDGMCNMENSVFRNEQCPSDTEACGLWDGSR